VLNKTELNLIDLTKIKQETSKHGQKENQHMKTQKAMDQ